MTIASAAGGLARQVVIGHQHLHALGVRHVDAGVRGDAVIDGDDQLRAARRRLLHHFGAQAVAVFKAVRHQIVDGCAAHAAQRQHRQRSAGGAVGVEIAHHYDAATVGQRLLQQADGVVDAVQLLPGQHALDAALQLLLTLHAAQGVKPAQQRRQTGGQMCVVRRRTAA